MSMEQRLDALFNKVLQRADSWRAQLLEANRASEATRLTSLRFLMRQVENASKELDEIWDLLSQLADGDPLEDEPIGSKYSEEY